MRICALLIGLLCMGAATKAHAAEWGFSPGVKLAWTPGRGVTYGIEVSVVRLPDLFEMPSGSIVDDVVDAAVDVITKTYGIVFNVDTTFKGLTKLRVGGEWIGPFIGVEAGPSLVFDRSGTHAGLGLTLWAGYTFYPFYTHTFVFGGRDTNELGAYLKTPLLGFGDGDADFDDDD
jgi:hypothetical protein